MRRINTTAPRGLVAALEAEEVVVAQAEAAAAPVGDNADSLETDLIEVAEITADGDVGAAQIDEAQEVACALEGIAEALGMAAKHGGMDRHSAAAVGVAVDHMYKRIGLKRQAMPALESFGGTSSRIVATEAAMDDIKKHAAEIWKKIVAAIQKAIEWAVAFFNSVFDAASKLKARAEALAAKAEATSGAPQEKSFENERLVKALHIAGSVPTNAASLKVVVELAKHVFSTTADYAGTMGEEIVKDLSDDSVIADFAAKFELPAFANDIDGKEVTNPESIGMPVAPEGLSLFRGNELPGGQAVVARAPKATLKGEEAVKALSGVGMSVTDFNAKAPEITKKDLATLEVSDAADIAKGVAELADHLLGYKAQAAKLADLKKKIVDGAAKLGEKTDVTDEQKTAIRGMQSVCASIPRWIDSPAKDFARYSVNTGKAMLDYVEESLKQHKAAAAPAAAKPAPEAAAA